MSMSLLNLLGTPQSKQGTTDGAAGDSGETAASGAGAAFASLLAAITSGPDDPAAGNGGGKQNAPTEQDDAQGGESSPRFGAGTPAIQVTVLPTVGKPVEAQPVAAAQAEPTIVETANTTGPGQQPTAAPRIATEQLRPTADLVVPGAESRPVTAIALDRMIVPATMTTPQAAAATGAPGLTTMGASATPLASSTPVASSAPVPTLGKVDDGADDAAPLKPVVAHETTDSRPTVASTYQRPTAAAPHKDPMPSGAKVVAGADAKAAAPTPDNRLADTSPVAPANTRPDAEAQQARASQAIAPDPQISATTAEPQPNATVGTVGTEVAAAAIADVDIASTTNLARTAAANQAGQTATHVPVDPAKIQAQVTRALVAQTTLSGGDESVTLQLNPEHLGKVEVQVTAQGNRLIVQFTAESPEAEVALREGGRDLAQALGVKAEGRWQHIDVKVSESNQSRSGQDDPDADDQNEPRQQREERDQRRDQDQRDPRRQRRRDR